MLKDFLYEADKIVSKLDDVGIIPMCKFKNNAVISGKSKDNSIIFSIVSKDEYTEQDFAFRDWTTVGSILSSFKNDENLSIEFKRIKNDEDGLEYPSRLLFKTKSITIEHFLQRYSIIAKSPMVEKEFKNKKAIVLEPVGVVELNINDDIASELSKISSIVNRPLFHFENINGEFYYCFGDVGSKSTDFGKVVLGDIPELTASTGLYFPIDIVLTILKAMSYNCRVCVKGKILFIFGEMEHSKIGISIAGKASE